MKLPVPRVLVELVEAVHVELPYEGVEVGSLEVGGEDLGRKVGEVMHYYGVCKGLGVGGMEGGMEGVGVGEARVSLAVDVRRSEGTQYPDTRVP